MQYCSCKPRRERSLVDDFVVQFVISVLSLFWFEHYARQEKERKALAILCIYFGFLIGRSAGGYVVVEHRRRETQSRGGLLGI